MRIKLMLIAGLLVWSNVAVADDASAMMDKLRKIMQEHPNPQEEVGACPKMRSRGPGGRIETCDEWRRHSLIEAANLKAKRLECERISPANVKRLLSTTPLFREEAVFDVTMTFDGACEVKAFTSIGNFYGVASISEMNGVEYVDVRGNLR
jgi:hypothetical protein